ncbi:hypothetical protein F5Y04DRAFT_47949 [Hypomontagnella monticulosa]|nr:hypothetical protein F5Y04DRAFT_47949 [Hypomontagnella monticulosa]
MDVAPQGTQSITAVWQFAPVPASLEASIIESKTYSEGANNNYVVTYQVDCPAAKSPENDACRDLSLYPQELYHTQGSVFGGTWTRDSKGATTWRCELGSCRKCSGFGAKTADCSLTINNSGSEPTTASVSVNSCFLAQQSVPVVITAGVEKLNPDGYKATGEVADYLSYYAAALSEQGCPERKAFQTIWPLETSTTTTSGADSSITPTTGPVASQNSPTPTAQSASPTPTSAGSARQSIKLGSGLMLMTGLLGLWLSL